MRGILSMIPGATASGSHLWSTNAPRLVRRPILPQADLLHLNPRQEGRDRVLFIAPISGHSSSLIQDLVKPAIQGFDAHVLDWHDPASLRPRFANYGAKTQRKAIRMAIEQLASPDKRLHIVAVCQSSSPTLIALDGIPGRMLTLTLVASPLFDAPGGVFDLFRTPEATEETFQQVEGMIAQGINGAPHLPAPTQLAAILSGSGGAMRNLNAALGREYLSGFGFGPADARHRRISLLDARNIPRKLLIEGLESNYVRRDHLNSKIDPAMPVHLVTGDQDSVVPPAQTLQFSNHFHQEKIVSSSFSGLDHFDLFASSIAHTDVAQRLLAFFADPHAATDWSD